MALKRSGPGLVAQIDAAEQRQAYNNFRKTRVLFRKIVERTPVLSGALRAGWHASYGAPDYSFVDVAGKKTGPAVRSAPVFDLTYDRKKAWHIFIANGAPYALRIENGWSDRAPQGMVRISVLEVFGATR